MTICLLSDIKNPPMDVDPGLRQFVTTPEDIMFISALLMRACLWQQQRIRPIPGNLFMYLMLPNWKILVPFGMIMAMPILFIVSLVQVPPFYTGCRQMEQ